MSNPMEGPNMNPHASELDEAFDRATAARKNFLSKHPDFVPKDKPSEESFKITPQMRREAERIARQQGDLH